MIRLVLFLVCFALPAAAQTRTPSNCLMIADATPGVQYLHKARFGTPLSTDVVRLNYLAHAMFLLETQGGLTVATDYTGFLGATDLVPDVVTMNHAHSTHYTTTPDPRIPHVLRGWGDEFGVGVEHYLDLDEMLVRNVTTDIRSFGDVEKNGNSIFVFEVAGLCIGHLGHLHQEPSPQQYGMLGRMDVVMAPVDGGYTLDQAVMIRVLQRLRSSIIVPMHWFGQGNLDRFLEGMEADFVVDRREANFIEISRDTLPRQPTVIVLRPQLLQ